MSASFPSASVSGPYSTPSSMYPAQGYNYNDPYSQTFANPPAANNYPPHVQQQPNAQPMPKPTYDPRQANGYPYQNGGPQMIPPMGQAPPYTQQMRTTQSFYDQQRMSHLPPVGMQKPPSSVASSPAMGPPNGMSHMMMQQPNMGQMSAASTVPSVGQMTNQMKSPMPGNMPQMPLRPPVPQMNSPGMFTAPAPPRMNKSMPSPGAMHMQMPNHPMGGDPSVSSGNHMVQPSAQMNSSAQQQQKTMPPPPSQETPFTAVTHHEMPAAFPQYQTEFKRHNPTTTQYYERRRAQLKYAYPTGQTQPQAHEPATFGFLPGQAHYEEQFDRRSNMPSNNMGPIPMSSNPMIQRQMSAPGITSPAYGQQQLMGAPSAPTAKRSKRSASTSVEAANSPYANQQNRMMSMGTFNNPNMKNGMMGINGQMGSMPPPTMPPSSVAGASNGMHMMNSMGQNGMTSVAMPSTSMSMGVDSMNQNGMNSHMSNGMPMNSMASNGGFAAPQDLRPPPQYTQMPSSSQQAFTNQMQQRYGNGLMSPGHQHPPTSMPQNGSHPGMPMQQQPQMQQQMFMRQLPPCNTCKGVIPPNTPAKICANPTCHRAFHMKCAGLSDAASSMLDSNADIGWVCPVCEPRSAR